MTWDDDAIRRAARDWVWIPDRASRVVTDDYTVVAYPEHFAQPTQVFRTRSRLPESELVQRVGKDVRRLGRGSAAWWVDDSTAPRGLEALLSRRGGAAEETVGVLALDLSYGLPDVDLHEEATARQVDDATTLRAWAEVDHGAWNTPPLSEDEFTSQLENLGSEMSSGELRVVGYLDDIPAAIGGCSIVDGVARLWGAATLREQQGRGAYRAVLHERLRLARAAGATLALVKGRLATSAPILRRAGFREVGEERAYLIAFD